MTYQYPRPERKAKQDNNTALGCGILIIICLVVVVLALACSAPGSAPETPRQMPPVTVTETTTVTVTETSAEPAPTPLPPVRTPQSPVQRKPVQEQEEADPPNQAPAPRITTTEQKSSAHYANCSAARAAGAAPVYAGEPGYGRHLDRDGDGVGCE